jgi:hypothetical protein
VLRAVRAGQFARPAQVARVPRELDAVVCKAMALRPADRYPTAEALRADVDAYLAHRPLVWVQSTPTERVAKWLVRHRDVVRTAASVAGIAAIALAGGAWRYLADVGEARDRAVNQAERAAEAERDARRQVVEAQLALADSHTEQGAVTAAGAALRAADAVAQTLAMDRRPLDWALSAHAAVSPAPIARCRPGHGAPIRALAVHPNGAQVATLDATGAWIQWSVAGCDPVQRGRALAEAPAADAPPLRAELALDDQGLRGLLSQGNRATPLWAGQAGTSIDLPDARAVVRTTLGRDDATVSLDDGSSWQISLRGGSAAPLGVARPDGAAWWPSGDLTLAVSLPSGGELGGAWQPDGTPVEAAGGITDIHAPPDGRWIAIATAFGHEVLDRTGQAPPSPTKALCDATPRDGPPSATPARRIWCRSDRATVRVSLSEDGQRLIATRYDGSVDVDRITDGLALARLEGDPSGRVRPAGASGDGRVIAIAAPDGEVLVYGVGAQPPPRLPRRPSPPPRPRLNRSRPHPWNRQSPPRPPTRPLPRRPLLPPLPSPLPQSPPRARARARVPPPRHGERAPRADAADVRSPRARKPRPPADVPTPVPAS